MKPTRLVQRPLAKLVRAEKVIAATAYLRMRGKYILDRGTPRPNWGAGERRKAA